MCQKYKRIDLQSDVASTNGTNSQFCVSVISWNTKSIYVVCTV